MRITIQLTKLLLTALLLMSSLCCSRHRDVADDRFMQGFVEDFDAPTPRFFEMRGSALRYYSGVHSLTEEDTDVMLMRIRPSDPWGPGKGPEIATPKRTHFGRYSARLRLADIKGVQPDAGIVTGYFTWHYTPGFGLSEIDFEWLLADPRLIYIGTWTSAPDDENKLQRVGRTVNLATGEILYTNYRSYHDIEGPYEGPGHFFDDSDDAALSPRTIPAIEGYDASKRFYVYGFDWYPDRLTWWIEHPDTGEKVILWDYQGTTPNYSGIPQSPTTYLLNFWHTINWAVETNPNSTEAPAYPYMIETDWMKYEPFEELNAEWLAANKHWQDNL